VVTTPTAPARAGLSAVAKMAVLNGESSVNPDSG